jgi:hypothetical protein
MIVLSAAIVVNVRRRSHYEGWPCLVFLQMAVSRIVANSDIGNLGDRLESLNSIEGEISFGMFSTMIFTPATHGSAHHGIVHIRKRPA